MAAAAFWIALAAVLIAGSWRRKLTEQMRHDTARLLIEKDGQLADQQIRDLLNPPVQPLPEGHPWARKPEPGSARKVLRVFGTILIVASVGIGGMVAGISYFNEFGAEQSGVLGFSVGGCLLLVGLGFFLASGFLSRSPDSES
jgi:hypothetical protein